MKRPSKSTELNPNELEVLGILWADNPRKPVEIQEAFSHPIENATLRSVLRNLVERGYLKRERIGKAYYYRPTRAARTVRRRLTDRLARVFAGGSRLGLIAQLIEDEKLSPAEIRELQAIASRFNSPENPS